MSRTKTTSWNFATNLLYTAVALVGGLISVPLLIRLLGKEQLGAVRTATDWSGYLGLFELGIGGALLPMMARAVAAGDPAVVLQTLSVGIQRYRRIAAAMVLAGVAIGICLPWLVPVDPVLRLSLQTGFAINLLGSSLIILSPFRTLMDANQRGFLINLYFAVQSVSITTLSIVLAYFHGGIIGQFVAMVGGNIVFWFLIARHVKKQYPGSLRLIIASSQHQQIGTDLSRLSRPTLILNACGRVGLLTDNIIIGLFLGPSAVVPFIVTQRLATIAQSQLQAVGNAAWAALAQLHMHGEHDVFRKRLVDLTTLVAVLAVASLAPIAAFNHHFVSVWVPPIGPGDRGNFAGNAITLLAVLNGFLIAMISLWGWVFSGTGNVARLVPVAAASAAINIVVSIGGTCLLGLAGPLLGTTVAIGCVSFPGYVFLLHKHYGISPLALLWRPALTIATGIPYGAALWWVAHHHQPLWWSHEGYHHILRWIGVAIEMAVGGAGSLLLAWFIILSHADRASWRHRLEMIVRRRTAA
jgi:O-antigen/teichoic acid export membrane protein